MIRGMNMKLMTVLAVASLAIAGVACSESKAKPASDATEAMKVITVTNSAVNLALRDATSSSPSRTNRKIAAAPINGRINT